MFCRPSHEWSCPLMAWLAHAPAQLPAGNVARADCCYIILIVSISMMWGVYEMRDNNELKHFTDEAECLTVLFGMGLPM